MVWITLAIVVSILAGVTAEVRSGGDAAGLARRALLGALYTVLPFVIFFNVARAEIDLDRGGGIVIAWFAIATAVTLVWLVASRLLRLPRLQTGTLMVCTIVSNTGYLGYPLVVALLGAEDLPDAAIYDVGVAFPALLLGAFSIGAAFGTEAGEGPRERIRAFFLRNPPLAAATAGILAPDALAPDVLVDISRVLVIGLLPVGFFAVGTLLGQRPTGDRIPRFERPIALVALAKIGLVPALLFSLSSPLLNIPNAYLILAAMPTGLNSMIVAHAYGLDTRLVAESITWTTAIVIATATFVQVAGIV